MRVVFELAARGWGATSPNPMVGAIVVKDGAIVGEGYHERAGLDHAEIVALKSAGEKACGADIFVNLEPCAHFGRTPPCADAIIKAKIARIFYGMTDPNPLVDGLGLQKLKAAGLKVIGPVMEKEALFLNKFYVNWIRRQRPYIISKVALSLDGKIATGKGSSKWITNEKCRKRMHYWRAGVDGVLIGAETLRKDDPLLTARGLGVVKQPRPIVITNKFDLNADRKLWTSEARPIIICPESEDLSAFEVKCVDLLRAKSIDGRLDWLDILPKLGEMGVTSLLVEGGGSVHAQIMENKLANYMIVTLSPKLIGSGGLQWLPGWRFDEVKDSPKINPDQILILDDNVVIEGEIDYGKGFQCLRES